MENGTFYRKPDSFWGWKLEGELTAEFLETRDQIGIEEDDYWVLLTLDTAHERFLVLMPQEHEILFCELVSETEGRPLNDEELIQQESLFLEALEYLYGEGDDEE